MRKIERRGLYRMENVLNVKRMIIILVVIIGS